MHCESCCAGGHRPCEVRRAKSQILLGALCLHALSGNPAWRTNCDFRGVEHLRVSPLCRLPFLVRLWPPLYYYCYTEGWWEV